MRWTPRPVLAAALALSVLPAGAHAVAGADIRGTWSCVPTSGGSCSFDIDSLDLETGKLSGHGSGNGQTWYLTGTLDGLNLTMRHGPYKQTPNYTATYTATVTADGRSMTGTFADTFGRTGQPFTYPRATAAQAPPPVVGTSVVAEPVTGTILVRRKGTSRFVPLRGERNFPTGTEFDTRRGTMSLVVAADAKGSTHGAEISEGRVIATQGKGAKPRTRLALSERLTGCPGRPRAAARKRRVKSRKVRVRETTGDFQTKGQYAAASVEGTEWVTSETCTTTKVSVIAGRVRVRDLVRNRSVTVAAGGSYTARRR